ncbi:MAG: prepilin-type N-terminal cleavage/methylation domain-containing protein [Candidatus Paceibacterota bacterium]|jgi:prepilin-type N-terminal cleavage/methylation domain-containing protein
MTNNTKNKKSMRGFTLIEILVSVAIFAVIIGVLTLFSRNVWIYNTFISSGFNNSDVGRQLLKTMVSEIRTASTADTGAYIISAATASSFTFYSDIDNDGLKEKVRYFLTGTTLQKGVIKPTGSPLTYNALNENISTLANNITSASIFDYYDKNYDGTTAPLTFPVDIPAIRLIKIIITMDQDPNRPPTPMTLSTQVSLRNLKDNL